MQSNSSRNEPVPPKLHARGTHGGRREGSERKKKGKNIVTPNKLASVPPSHSTSSVNQNSNTPVFFAPRGLQGNPERATSTHGVGGSSGMSLFHYQMTAQNFSILTSETYHCLMSEVVEVMDNDEYADIRIESGREIDESVSNNMDDSMEKNARMAEQETIASEVPECSLIHQYLVDYRNGLRKQIDQYGMPKCYKEKQFIVQPPHPVFALHDAASRTAFNPDMLCLRPIFVWLLEYLPGRPDRFKCRCEKKLTMNGYNDNPIARQVHTSSGDFLFTNRYICDSRRRNDPGCGVSYQGSDPHILDQLPRWVQEAFPGRFGPEPFSKMLHELQMLQHSRKEVMYLSAAASLGLSGAQVPQFPSFEDQMSYAGSSPSVWYLKCIWTDYHAAIMKAMARLKSEPIFSALFSLVNEWEEIRTQAMGLTKGFSVLPEMFKQVQQGLEEHGHQPTNIYYCDNPSAERDFHERVMESLKRDIVHISRTGSATMDNSLQYPDFKLSSTTVVEFYSDFMLMNNACETILEQVEALAPAETLVAALSISKTMQKSLYSIQLWIAEKIFVFEISHLTPVKIPPCLRSVLTSSRIIKLGHGILESILCIAAFLDMPDLKSIASHDGPFLDLGRLAKVKGVIQDAYVSLDSLTRAVLKKALPQISDISLPASLLGSSHWSRTSALHVDVMWQTYLSLIQCKSVGLRLHPSETHPGQLVTLAAACKEVAEGIILDHDGKVDVIMDENGNTTQLKITPAYTLVQINKVLVPGAILAKHKQTVQWIFEHGQKAVVQTRTLCSRSAIPPLPIDSVSSSILGIPAPTSSAEPESIMTIGPSQSLLDQSLTVSDEDDLQEDPSTSPDSNEDKDDEDDTEDESIHTLDDNDDVCEVLRSLVLHILTESV
ncbi:hypothetical protein C8R42DRAFT_644315 [Lentinula raphanica]|nr:hypothetical protein C8R42DRAFT_644315 [Lentinula raphanica]